MKTINDRTLLTALNLVRHLPVREYSTMNTSRFYEGCKDEFRVQIQLAEYPTQTYLRVHVYAQFRELMTVEVHEEQDLLEVQDYCKRLRLHLS